MAPMPLCWIPAGGTYGGSAGVGWVARIRSGSRVRLGHRTGLLDGLKAREDPDSSWCVTDSVSVRRRAAGRGGESSQRLGRQR